MAEQIGRAGAPAASLHGRWPPPRVAPTPAPCDYEPIKAVRVVYDHAPAFSIGLRVQPPKPGGKTPGLLKTDICSMWLLPFSLIMSFHLQYQLCYAVHRDTSFIVTCSLSLLFDLLISFLFFKGYAESLVSNYWTISIHKTRLIMLYVFLSILASFLLFFDMFDSVL